MGKTSKSRNLNWKISNCERQELKLNSTNSENIHYRSVERKHSKTSKHTPSHVFEFKHFKRPKCKTPKKILTKRHKWLSQRGTQTLASTSLFIGSKWLGITSCGIPKEPLKLDPYHSYWIKSGRIRSSHGITTWRIWWKWDAQSFIRWR